MKNIFLMENYIQFFPSIEEAIETVQQTKTALRKLGFTWLKLCQMKLKF